MSGEAILELVATGWAVVIALLILRATLWRGK